MLKEARAIVGRLRRVAKARLAPSPALTNTEYWTSYNVTSHRQFASREESLNDLRWRNAQYLFYDDLMPCSGHDSKVILDYGCGPGHDLVGFYEFSNPARLVGADISPASLKETRERLQLHGGDSVELVQLEEDKPRLPFEDGTFDYIHSSGVIHHTPNPSANLKEFRRTLKPSGTARIMVYNYHCIWLHLFVAYERRIVRKMDAGLPLEESFKRSTDTEECPISRWYRPEEFLQLCSGSGFTGKLAGCAISINEMEILPKRYQALRDLALPDEHREFLHGLTFDGYGRPLWKSHVAGIDAVYELGPA